MTHGFCLKPEHKKSKLMRCHKMIKEKPAIQIDETGFKKSSGDELIFHPRVIFAIEIGHSA